MTFKVKFAVISQEDHLLKKLTISEQLMYASKIKNKSPTNHKAVVDNILEKLNISQCANNLPDKCSGGQQKRICIAMELVSRPNVLILDEPTSGLDSVTTWQLINTLIELTKLPEPLAIVATIHQPSARLFNLFSSVYIMSYDGQCIYQGLPQSMIGYLGQYGLICPDFSNPSDFVLEIASKEYGIEKVMMLSSVMRNKNEDIERFDNEIKQRVNIRFFNNLKVLTQRLEIN